MLNVDCLLKNTDFIDGVKKYIKYLGHDHAAEGKNASFEAIYDRLRKEKVEIDIETAGQLYLHELPVDEHPDIFSSRDEVENISGREFDQTAKNLLLSKPKTGEKEIGNLPPRKSIAKRIADTFNNSIIEDHTTSTILRKIQDMYTKTLDRYVEKLPGKPGEPDRPFEQIVEEGLNKMNLGHRDTETGFLNNLSTLHEGVKAELKELTDKLEATGDHIKAEQWKKHVENFQNSVFELALSSKEAREVVDKALMAKGFEKTDKKGNKSVDLNKLAGNNNSVSQLREHVIDALSGKFDKATAEKVAKVMQREYLDKLSSMVEYEDKLQAKKKQSWVKPVRTQSLKVDDVVGEQVKRWDNYIGYAGRGNEPFTVSKKTAADALRHILVEAGLSRQIGKKGELKVDIDKVSNAITNPPDIKKIATDYFAGLKNDDGTAKYDANKVSAISDAMDGMYQEMFNKVREHVEGKQKAIEETWNPTTTATGPAQVDDIITKRLHEWNQYKKITQNANAPLQFRKNEAQRLVGEALKNSTEYGKDSKTGKLTNWIKLAENRPTEYSLTNLLEKQYKNREVAEALSRDFHSELDKAISEHAQAMLDQKTAAMDRETPERKTAIQRLAELHSLGLFEDQNQKLLYHVLGVDKANVQDLAALKDLAQTVTELGNETGNGKEYLNSYAYQAADRIASNLIANNKDDKSRMLKLTRIIKTTYGLANMTLISNPFNLMENNWSGQSAILGSKGELTKQMGLNAKMFSNRQLWWAIFKDVAIGGIEYGGAGDKWAHISDALSKLNTLNFKENPVRATATALMLPFRALLNGSDAANKAILHYNGMLLMMHRAMMEQGWDNDDASHFLYEALYGENFDNAKQQAYDLIDKYGDKLGIGKSTYSRERAAIRWANDLVKANLNLSADASLHGSNKPITHDIIEAALNSSFHAAAISMGHEANNRFSKMVHAGKNAAFQEENDLIERGKYNQAAAHRLWNTVWFDGVYRMAGGGANWAVLRAEGLGLGLKAAINGDIRQNVVFESKTEMEQHMQDRILASRQMSRALMGLATTAVALGSVYGYGLMRTKKDDEDSEEDGLQSGFQGIKGNYILNRAWTKAGPDLAMLDYMIKTGQGEGENAALYGTLKYIENLININPQFTIGGHLTEGTRAFSKGTDKGADKMWGEVGKSIGDIFLPGVPLYKPYKQTYQIIREATGGEKMENTYTKPKTLIQGMLMGGFFQAMINEAPDSFIENHHLEDWITPDKKPAE